MMQRIQTSRDKSFSRQILKGILSKLEILGFLVVTDHSIASMMEKFGNSI